MTTNHASTSTLPRVQPQAAVVKLSRRDLVILGFGLVFLLVCTALVVRGGVPTPFGVAWAVAQAVVTK